MLSDNTSEDFLRREPKYLNEFVEFHCVQIVLFDLAALPSWQETGPILFIYR